MTIPLTWSTHPDGSETVQVLGFEYSVRQLSLEWYSIIEDNKGIQHRMPCSTIAFGKAWCQSHHDAILKAAEEVVIERSVGAHRCPLCRGEGQYKHQVSEFDYEMEQCPTCNATGEVYIIPALTAAKEQDRA